MGFKFRTKGAAWIAKPPPAGCPRYAAAGPLLQPRPHESVKGRAPRRPPFRQAKARPGRWSYHHAQPFCRPRDAGIQPARTAVLERKALVEQHDVVPLRALRLVHGQHIAIVELVIGLALLPRDRLDAAFKSVLAHRDLCDLV